MRFYKLSGKKRIDNDKDANIMRVKQRSQQKINRQIMTKEIFILQDETETDDGAAPEETEVAEEGEKEEEETEEGAEEM